MRGERAPWDLERSERGEPRASGDALPWFERRLAPEVEGTHVGRGPEPEPAAPALPRLQVAELDEDALAVVVGDLARCAHVMSVRVRAAAVLGRVVPCATLDEAHRALRDGAASGVQVRYAYAGRVWCDTFTTGPTGIRLTRMEIESPPTGTVRA